MKIILYRKGKEKREEVKHARYGGSSLCLKEER